MGPWVWHVDLSYDNKLWAHSLQCCSPRVPLRVKQGYCYTGYTSLHHFFTNLHLSLPLYLSSSTSFSYSSPPFAFAFEKLTTPLHSSILSPPLLPGVTSSYPYTFLAIFARLTEPHCSHSCHNHLSFYFTISSSDWRLKKLNNNDVITYCWLRRKQW